MKNNIVGSFNTMSVGELKRLKSGSFGTLVDPKTGTISIFKYMKSLWTKDHYFIMAGTSDYQAIYMRRPGISSAVWRSEEEIIRAFRSKKYAIN